MTARYALGRLWRRIDPVRNRRAVSIPAGSGVVVRSLRWSDGSAWRRARRRESERFPEAEQCTVAHSFRRWVYALWCSKTGFRSPRGVVFAIARDGSYIGEVHLFGLDMFDRNAWLNVWIDPACAEEELRVTVTRRLLEYGFEQLGLYRIAMALEDDDTESAVAAARSGLVKEGTMRDYFGPRGRRADHSLWALTVGREVEDARVHPQ